MNAAELNEFKLQMRYDELIEEINQIKEEEEEAKENEADEENEYTRQEKRRNFYNNSAADNLQG